MMGEKMFTRADHDQILTSFLRPVGVVATRQRPGHPVLKEGDEADLRDDEWIIRTEDPSLKIGASVSIDFSLPVANGGVRLNDAARINDLITAKLFVAEMLRGQWVKPNVANVVGNRYSEIIWIIRWRLASGLDQMSQITPALFQDYCDRLKMGGRSALVPVEERISRLGELVRNGRWAWPRRSSFYGTTLDFDQLAKTLGVTRSVLAMPGPIAAELMDAVKNTDPEIIIARPARSEKKPKRIIGQGVSVNTAQASVAAWRVLNTLSANGVMDHDPLTFDPFEGVNPEQVVRSIGYKPDGRTGTVPPAQLLHLMEAAAAWVLDYSQSILHIWENIEEYFPANINLMRQNAAANARIKAEQAIAEALPRDRAYCPRVIPYVNRHPELRDRRDVLTFEEAIHLLAVACIVLIGAFGARRYVELTSLKVGCTETDETGNCWLSSYIAKTIRGVDRIPVPRSVRTAAAVLERLSAPARLKTGQEWITKIHPIHRRQTSRKFLHVDLRRDIQWLADVVGVPPLPDGTAWQFSPHQLRRGFAVYYYYGNSHSSLDALSRFLRHFDPEMTRRYITEVAVGSLDWLRDEMQAKVLEAEEAADLKTVKEAAVAASSRSTEWSEVREEALVDHMLDMYDGDETPFGHGGRRLRSELNEMVESTRNIVRLERGGINSPDVEREVLVTVLKRFARTRHVEPHPAGHAHCGLDWGNEKHLAEAKCLQAKRAFNGEVHDARPDFSFARDMDCLGCGHCVGFKENQRVVEKRLAQVTDAAERGPTPAIKAASASRYNELLAGYEAAKKAATGVA